MQKAFVQYLTEALTGELPGAKAHQKLSPPGRELKLPTDGEKAITSGVLVLLFPEEGRLYTCLIKRPASMKHHPGQIGFPGGKVENNDLSSQMTAMREANEEIGLSPDSYAVIGKLSNLYVPVSNFIIHPYVAWADEKPELKINDSEVEKMILFPVQDFMENEKLEETEINTFSGILKVPYYPFNGEIIWGATAMILSELFEVSSYYQPVRE